MSGMNQDTYSVSSKSFTAVAVNTASRAGEYMKSKLGQTFNVQVKSSLHDLVTEVDKGTEALIRNSIHTYFPEHYILGEEGAGAGPEAAMKALGEMENKDYVWIVDPIDGTTNFVHGLPFYSVSIALAYKGDVIVGVVYDPMRSEMFVAEKGKGAYLRGKPLKVSDEKQLADSLVATGFPTERDRALPSALQQITAVAPCVQNIRVAGSAALHLAYVAAGRLSGFWENNLNAWDIAAGMLLIKEAGGRITDMNGEPYQLQVRDVIATNGHIHDELLNLVK